MSRKMETADIKSGKEKYMSELLWDIREKIDIGRYKLVILQELFAVPPGCDGYNEPEDPCLFYMGVKTILEEIVEENGRASEDLTDLCFTERSKEKMATA